MTSYASPPPRLHDQPIYFSMIHYDSNDRVPFVLPAEAELLHQNDYTRYYGYRGLWIIYLQTAVVIINRKSNKIIAFVHGDDLKKPKYLEDFMHPLLELLRHNGVYAHHAAAVSLQGQGLLLLGKSGQGKTTLSVDLLAHGFDFLSDDRCFLQTAESGMLMIGHYEPVRYFPVNLDHIEPVRTSETNNVPVYSNGKSELDLYPVYRDQIISESRLAGLVFPHHDPEEEHSRMEPMSANEALITVLPLTMVCFDRHTSKTHFDFCVKLTSLPCVKMILGRDRERWHVLIREYLDSIHSST